MGAWIKSNPPWWWPFGAGEWEYRPAAIGDENPNLPPPSITATATRGPVYNSSDGHNYRTWMFPGSFYQHVDWREKLDLTGGDPNAIEPTKGQ